MNNGYKIIAAIADIHIGIKRITAEEIKKQLKNNFIKPLKQFSQLDGIFILGDIMHTIVSLNSDYAEVFYWFIDQVYKIAREKHSTIIILKGTQSHDNDQLNNIKHYQKNDDHVDFRVYETVEEITLWDNYKLLILPDVKFKQTKDIDKYFKKKNAYDMILGHGVIDNMRFFIQETENMPLKTYVYNVDDLVDASKGPILFGHIHQFQAIANQFYYVGPFTLLERGGIDSGFVVVGISNDDHKKYKVEHFINPDSADYHEIKISKKIIDTYSIDDIISAIDEIKDSAKDNDLVTLRITRGDERDAADKVMMLENRYRSDPRFSIIKKIKTKKEEELEKENEQRKEKYEYILDENLDLTEMFYRYYVKDVLPSLSNDSKNNMKITESDFNRSLKNREK